MSSFWKVVLGLLAIGAVASLVMLFNGSQPVGSENLVGRALPDFAAPLAKGTQNADANVYTPAQAKAAKSTAACDVDLPGAFNSCRDLTGSAILTFWNSTKGECVKHVAALEAFHRTRPKVNVAAVAFDQTEGSVRAFVAPRRWTLPVAIDRDGAVAALYAVAGCPTTFFARNGEITGVKLGVLTPAQFERMLAAPTGAAGASG